MEFEIVSGSYDGLVQGFCVDALDPGTQVCKPAMSCPISYPCPSPSFLEFHSGIYSTVLTIEGTKPCIISMSGTVYFLHAFVRNNMEKVVYRNVEMVVTLKSFKSAIRCYVFRALGGNSMRKVTVDV